MKKLLFIFLLLTVFFSSLPTWAALIPFNASPSSDDLSSKLSALIRLDQPQQIANISESTLILDLMRSRGITLNSIVGSGTYSLSWTPIPGAAAFTINTTEGVLSVDGVGIGSRNSTISGTCATLFCPTFAESLTLTSSEKSQIVERILANVTLGDVLRKSFTPPSITVDYERVWNVTGLAVQISKFSIIAGASTNIDVKLNQTRLLSVKGTTTTLGLPIASNAQVNANLNWQATLQSIGTPVPTTIQSASAQIVTPDGKLIQRINQRVSNSATRAKTLAQSFPSQTTTTATETLSERMPLSAAIAAKARQLGANRIIIQRDFTDGFNVISASTTIPLTSASAAGFQITRVDLSFVDGSRVKIANTDDSLQVKASINYTGTGQLQAIWEWAPLISSGQPLFRPLPASGKPKT
ncbi:MAG: hypothetical protein ACI8P9_000717 [Parasphingorhabdus sp.]|jgi:hypothetical protein